MKKRLLSILLTVAMVLTLLPVSTIAESPEAQWGVAAADGTKPIEWEGSGTLQDAVTYANELSGGVAYIQLQSDTTSTLTLILTQGTTTLDLNGCTLSAGIGSGVFTINNGTLTIADSSDGGSGKVTSAKCDRNTGAINVNGGNLVVDGGIVSGVGIGSCAIYNNGTVSVNGGTVKSTGNYDYSVIYNNGSGSVSIDGGEVSGYSAIFMSEYSTGTVNVTGGKVIGTGGYAIESQGKGSIIVTDGEIIGKSCAIRCTEYSTANVSVTGGELTSTNFWTIFIYGTGSLSVTDARVEGKISGAIYHNGKGKFTIGGTAVVASAHHSPTAGTIYVEGSPTLEITGGTVENTFTGTTGNAIYAPSANVSIKSSSSPIIIKGPGAAMVKAPMLIDTLVKTAATNVNGTDGVETYQPNNITAYKYLEFMPAVAKIGSTGYATVQAAIDAVADDQTITLLKDTTEKIVIPGEFTRYFTFDLNGKTLSGGSHSADSNTISYSGGGVLTITDNSFSGGGKITKEDNLSDNGAVIQSSGKGKIIVNGEATISADKVASISIAGDEGTANNAVLEINGGTVGSPSQICTIRNEGLGKVLVLDGSVTGETGISSTNTGEIIVLGGTIKGSKDHVLCNDYGTVTLKSGTVENMDSDLGEAIYCAQIKIDPVDTVAVKSGTQAMSSAPALPEDTTSYQWRTSSVEEFAMGPYSWNASHTYMEIKPACAVTYQPGINGTGSQVTDSKTHNVALTLRGAAFTREGYTQTGWATTDGGAQAYALNGIYAANKGITLYPVWTPITYVLTVNNGTGDGNFTEGATVSITANSAPTGEIFDKWTTTTDGVIFANANNATTTFTMPASNVTVTATFKDKPAEPVIPDPPTPPATGDSSYTPPQPSVAGGTGWIAVNNAVSNAQEGSNVAINMNGGTELPKSVLDAVKGKDINLVITMSNGYVWTINGKDIIETKNIDLTVKKPLTQRIPTEVLNTVTGEKYQLYLGFEGDFGFKAVLTVPLGSTNSGRYANLFYYNPATKKLEYVSSGKIGSNGNAGLDFSHASDYVITITSEISTDVKTTPDSSETDTSFESNPTTGDKAIPFGAILFIATGAILITNKKAKRN